MLSPLSHGSLKPEWVWPGISNLSLKGDFMRDTSTSVPEIIKNLNPVTEQFDSDSQDSRQMQKSLAAQNGPGFLHELLTKAEQAICDMATD
jgi:hypothetical protein